MAKPFEYEVELAQVRATRFFNINPLSVEANDFLELPNAKDIATKSLRELAATHPIAAPDPDVGEAPRALGVLTPSIVAAKLQADLRAAYPEEQITFFASGKRLKVKPSGGPCEVHDLPDAGLAKKMIELSRERGAEGVNICAACIVRARDAKKAGGCGC